MSVVLETPAGRIPLARGWWLSPLAVIEVLGFVSAYLNLYCRAHGAGRQGGIGRQKRRAAG